MTVLKTVDVLIVGEKCSRAHLGSVRALRSRPRVKNQPYGWNSHKFLATQHEINDNFNKSLIHIMLDKLTIQNDLTSNILRGKPIPGSWD